MVYYLFKPLAVADNGKNPVQRHSPSLIRGPIAFYYVY